MLMSRRIIPTAGEPPTPQSFDSTLELSWNPLDVSFSLQIEYQCLVEFDFSSWTHLILIGLCYALGLCHSFQSCALSPSLLFHTFFPEPCLGPQCCLYNLMEGQPENSWPLRRKYCMIFNPSRIQVFIFHVSYNVCNNSISPWTH